MIQYQIKEEMVEAVLLQPRWSATSRNVRYDGIVGGRKLAVVVAAQDETIVVTTFWAEE